MGNGRGRGTAKTQRTHRESTELGNSEPRARQREPKARQREPKAIKERGKASQERGRANQQRAKSEAKRAKSEPTASQSEANARQGEPTASQQWGNIETHVLARGKPGTGSRTRNVSRIFCSRALQATPSHGSEHFLVGVAAAVTPPNLRSSV